MVIGMTGGMGCGKTQVCRTFKEWGFGYIDSDGLVEQLLSKNRGVRQEVKRMFGDRVFDGEGKVVKKLLAREIFNDRKKLEEWEKYIHPVVLKKSFERMKRENQVEHWVVEVPLLFEKGWETKFDFTICVIASKSKQVERLLKDGFELGDIEKRMERQLSLEEKARRANMVIENNGDEKDLKEQVNLIIRKLLQSRGNNNTSHSEIYAK